MADNTTWIGSDSKTIQLKYFEIKVEELKLKDFKNNISYCYNAGELSGDYEFNMFGSDITLEQTHYNGGIIGFIGWGWGSYSGNNNIDYIGSIINGDTKKFHTQVIKCYYWKNENTTRGTNNLFISDKVDERRRRTDYRHPPN